MSPLHGHTSGFFPYENFVACNKSELIAVRPHPSGYRDTAAV
jgi:hypothetical protein